MSGSDNIAVYIDPPSYHFLGDQLFNVDHPRYNRDQSLAPYAYLRNYLHARGVEVHTADRLPKEGSGQGGAGRAEGASRERKAIYISLGYPRSYRGLARRRDIIMSAFFTIEPPVSEPKIYRSLRRRRQYFKRVFSWNDGRALEHLTGERVMCERFDLPQPFDAAHETAWARTDRKFLVMINSNRLPRLAWRELYSERLRAVEFFSRTGEIDLYGMGWNDPPNRNGTTWTPYTLRRIHRECVRLWQRFRPDPLLEAARRVFRGAPATKVDTLGRYIFALCFENSILEGYVTEKIFDCFYSGTVPIYWGAPDIERYVPPECFIDMRRFNGYDDLRSHLRSLGGREIRRYRESAREFLASPRFRPFTKRAFAELFLRIIEEDTGLRLAERESECSGSSPQLAPSKY
jgi:hypothetical protein